MFKNPVILTWWWLNEPKHVRKDEYLVCPYYLLWWLNKIKNNTHFRCGYSLPALASELGSRQRNVWVSFHIIELHISYGCNQLLGSEQTSADQTICKARWMQEFECTTPNFSYLNDNLRFKWCTALSQTWNWWSSHVGIGIIYVMRETPLPK
jgi:hypothetical protein